jgi:hypothetical protein
MDVDLTKDIALLRQLGIIQMVGKPRLHIVSSESEATIDSA